MKLPGFLSFLNFSIIKRHITNFKPSLEKKEVSLKVIEIDIRIDNIWLQDRFEWDINDSSNSPEDFAYAMCNDLGLNEEFATQIAHSVREQILYFKKVLLFSYLLATGRDSRKA